MHRHWLLVLLFSVIVILSISTQLTIAQNIVAIEPVTNGVDGHVPLHQQPSISADGRYIVYKSISKNLACNYTSNHDISNIFLFDNQTNTAECVSVAPAGHPGNDGCYVTFISRAGLVIGSMDELSPDLYLRDGDTGGTSLLIDAGSSNEYTSLFNPVISANGNFVAFNTTVPGDPPGYSDILIYNPLTQQIKQVSDPLGGMHNNGHSMSPSISIDGEYSQLIRGL